MNTNTSKQVICIDASAKPNEIPNSKWVIKGNTYTVVKTANLPMSGGILGYQLAEIDLSDCVPYLYFAASRFRDKESIKTIEKEKVKELVTEEVAA